MRIRVFKFGKPVHSAYEELYEHFTQRIKTLTKFDFEVKKLSQGDIVLGKAEIDALAGSESSLQVLLDEDGQQFGSEHFAQRLATLRDDPQIKLINVFIGGPFGFSPELKKATKERWSMSKALMPSDLATVVFLEQLYRGLTILKGTGYHHP